MYRRQKPLEIYLPDIRKVLLVIDRCNMDTQNEAVNRVICWRYHRP